MSEQWVQVDGRKVRLTNLDRVLYPTGFTKAELITYYTAVAPALLRQLHNRPVTRIRFPEGVGGERFFEKNLPKGAPEWVRHQEVAASPGTEDEGTILTSRSWRTWQAWSGRRTRARSSCTHPSGPCSRTGPCTIPTGSWSTSTRDPRRVSTSAPGWPTWWPTGSPRTAWAPPSR